MAAVDATRCPYCGEPAVRVMCVYCGGTGEELVAPPRGGPSMVFVCRDCNGVGRLPVCARVLCRAMALVEREPASR